MANDLTNQNHALERTENDALRRAVHGDVVSVFTNIYCNVSCFPCVMQGAILLPMGIQNNKPTWRKLNQRTRASLAAATYRLVPHCLSQFRSQS